MKRPRKPLSAAAEARRLRRIEEQQWQREERTEWDAAHRESMRHVDNCLCGAVSEQVMPEGVTCFQKRITI